MKLTQHKFFFYIVLLPFLTLLYYFAGKFGLSLAIIHESSSAVWPPTGLALAAALMLGYRVWPMIFVGAFLVNFTTAGNAATSLGIAFGNTVEALLNAYLIRKYAKGCYAFDRVFNVLKFVFLIAAFGACVSATIGVTSLSLGGFALWSQYNTIWATWWMGNVVSAIIITPLLIIWLAHPLPKVSVRELFEAIIFIGIVIFISEVIFSGWLLAFKQHYPIEYLGIPLLLYSVFRFGRHGTITVAFLISSFALWGTLHHEGPFWVSDPNKSLLLLQSFMGMITVTSLILASVIFENKRVEEILRKQEGRDKFRAVTETAQDAIICADRTGAITYFNRAARNIFGYSAEEALGKSFTFLMSERFQEEHEKGFKRYLETGEGKLIGKTVEIFGKRSDGTEFPLELSLASWKSKNEIFFSAVIKDLTVQKKTELLLQKKNTFILLLQVIAVAANQAQSLEEVFQVCLDEICSHLGWSVGHAYMIRPNKPRELISSRIWYFKDKERFQLFREATESMQFPWGKGIAGLALASGRPQWFKNIAHDPQIERRSAAERVGLKTGFAFPILIGVNVAAILEFFSDEDIDPDPFLLEMMGNISSQIGRVIEREEAQEALQNAYNDLELRVEERTKELSKANEKLKRLDKLKSDFILAASHELRTPLTSIKGYILLILQEKVGAINQQQKEFMNHIHKATDRLQRLVNDLLNLSKIESGQVMMNKEEVKIAEVLKEEVTIFKAEADQKKIALELHLENDLGTLFCDQDKIREVIENLISNALKFTRPAGRVEVIASAKEQRIEILVKDTGIGIKTEEQEKIFDPFHYAHKRAVSGEESTGLGLALAKRIVLAHQGEIFVESRENAGSTFKVILPKTTNFL